MILLRWKLCGYLWRWCRWNTSLMWASMKELMWKHRWTMERAINLNGLPDFYSTACLVLVHTALHHTWIRSYITGRVCRRASGIDYLCNNLSESMTFSFEFKLKCLRKANICLVRITGYRLNIRKTTCHSCRLIRTALSNHKKCVLQRLCVMLPTALTDWKRQQSHSKTSIHFVTEFRLQFLRSSNHQCKFSVKSNATTYGYFAYVCRLSREQYLIVKLIIYIFLTI